MFKVVLSEISVRDYPNYMLYQTYKLPIHSFYGWIINQFQSFVILLNQF